MDQIGAPIDCVITTPSITISDLVDMIYEDGRNVGRHYAQRRYPRGYIGQGQEKLTIITTDAAIWAAFTQGLEVLGITARWQGPYSTPAAETNAVGLQHAKVFTMLGSVGRVTSSLKLPGKVEDGTPKPQEYEIVIEPFHKEADDAAPVWTNNFA